MLFSCPITKDISFSFKNSGFLKNEGNVMKGDCSLKTKGLFASGFGCTRVAPI